MEDSTSDSSAETKIKGTEQISHECNDSSTLLDQSTRNGPALETTHQTKVYKNKYFIAFMIFIVPIVIAVKVQVLFPHVWEAFEDNDEPYGPVSAHIMKIFEQYDENRDMKLNPFEFQTVFFAIKANNIDRVSLSDQETENLDGADLKKEILSWNFSKDDPIVQLRSRFQPLILETMAKFQNKDEMDENSLFHLNGLKDWKSANIEQANFSVYNLGLLLPMNRSNLEVGKTWEIIPKAMAGVQHNTQHLTHYRYVPPHPADVIETALLHLLAMFHKRPFLHMRFPPRGAVGVLRAENDDQYEIMFRMHPEFQLNEPPNYPFWFTPASLIGRMVTKKDGSKIDYFKMYLPNHTKLNVDMEWITGKPDLPDKKPEVDEGSLPKAVHDGEGQEVDIGYMPEMSIESTQPSDLPDNIKSEGQNINIEKIKWHSEISTQHAYQILEREFYPFKEIPYLPFNQTFTKADSEGKLIHHILMWGALDDQSC